MIGGTHAYALIAACALFAGASFAQGRPRPLQGTLEARIAALKAIGADEVFVCGR